MSSPLQDFAHRFDVRWTFFKRIPPGACVLELGCGIGVNFGNLTSMNPTVQFHGIDLLPPSDVPAGIHYTRMNLESASLPFADGTFDAVLFTHVIEHLRETDQVGNEISRVLKPGGIIYVETPNWTSMLVPSFRFRREQHNPFNFFDDPTHVRPYTKHSLFAFVTDTCRLRLERVGTVRNWPRMPWDFLKIFYGLISGNRGKVINAFWSIYGWCIYAVGRKE